MILADTKVLKKIFRGENAYHAAIHRPAKSGFIIEEHGYNFLQKGKTWVPRGEASECHFLNFERNSERICAICVSVLMYILFQTRAGLFCPN